MPPIKETLYSLISYISGLLIYPLLRCAAVLLLVWLIIKFLPAVLQRVGLRKSVDDKALLWLNTAIIGFVIVIVIIQPFSAFVANHFPR